MSEPKPITVNPMAAVFTHNADLEAENARLQTALTKAEAEVTRLGTQTIVWASWLQMRDERDRYKALAERRGEALNNMWGLHHGFSHKGHLNRDTCPATSCQDARAAIDATPEAREKVPQGCETCGDKRRAFGTCEFNVLPHPCKDAGPCPDCAPDEEARP
jgi:hypothetical protein